MGDEEVERLDRRRIVAGEAGGGDLGRRREGRRPALERGDAAIDPHQAGAAEEGLGAEPAERTSRDAARGRSRARVTGPRSMCPPSPGTGIQAPRAWISAPAPRPVPGPTTTRGRSGTACAAADRVDVARPEAGQAQRQRLEIVEEDHRREAEARDQLPRLEDPRAVGEAAPPRRRSARRARGSPIFGRSAVRASTAFVDRVVDGRVIGGLDVGKPLPRRVCDRRSARSAHWCRRCRRSAPESGCRPSLPAITSLPSRSRFPSRFAGSAMISRPSAR